MIRAWGAAALLLLLGACSAPLPAASGGAKPSPAGPPPPPMSDDSIACTAEVRQCPDGRFVSRDPAYGCAFAPCSGASQ